MTPSRVSAARSAESSRWRPAVSAALALLFLAGSAAEAYGLHDCPVHHEDPAAPSGDAPRNVHDRPGPADAPLHPDSRGPCSCIGACHGGAATPAWSPDVGTPTVPSSGTRTYRRAAPAETAPSRDPTVLLPYATGPPATPVCLSA